VCGLELLVADKPGAANRHVVEVFSLVSVLYVQLVTGEDHLRFDMDLYVVSEFDHELCWAANNPRKYVKRPLQGPTI
jgi:hypothetical protein